MNGWRHTLLLCLAAILLGCAVEEHDARLDRYDLQETLTPAENLAKGIAAKDLGCAALTAKELSGKTAEGAPLGPVWRDYEVLVTGCGKSQAYMIQCEGDGTCFEKSP
jgi:hypothetical protein